MLCSDVGSYYEGNTLILPFTLDVYNGWDSNGANLQIYYADTGNYAQKFTLSRNTDSTYVIKTKRSLVQCTSIYQRKELNKPSGLFFVLTMNKKEAIAYAQIALIVYKVLIVMKK